MDIQMNIQESKNLHVRTDVHAGYRPVHGWVYPDSMGKWMTGWFDMDTMGTTQTLGAAPGSP